MRRRRQGVHLSIPSLFCICFALLILSGCGGASTGSGGTSSGNTCSNTPSAPGCAYLSNLHFDVADAAQMHLNDTQILKVTLYSVSNLLIANAPKPDTGVPAENATVTTNTANPYIGGTPATTLQNAFGPGYVPYAMVRLDVKQNPFVVSPLVDVSTPQPLNVASVQWLWQLQPKNEGRYLFNVEIDAIWKPQQPSSNLPVRGPLTLGDAQFRVEVVADNAVINTQTPINTPSPTGSGLSTTLIVTLISLFGAIVAMVAVAAIFIRNRKPSDNAQNAALGARTGPPHGPGDPHNSP